MKLPEIEELADRLTKYPGITKKQSYKIIYFLLENSSDNLTSNFNQFQSILKNIKKCLICKDYTIEKICQICSSSNREKILMIVENAKQISNYEEWQYFKGKYYQIPYLFNKKFELNSNYDLSFLLDYINNFEEIIISLSPTTEGILTSNYLFEQIKNRNNNIKITRLATGIQVGSLLDYTDKTTIYYALKDRKEIE